MKELDFLKNTLENAYEMFCKTEVVVSEKAAFDVVLFLTLIFTLSCA